MKPSGRNSPYGVNSVWEYLPNGDVKFVNASLRLIIALAYQIDIRFTDVLLSGSQAVLERRFDIAAKAPTGVTDRSQANTMLRALLRNRFALGTHTETRDIPTFALTIARAGRLGRNLKETTVDCSRFDSATEPSGSGLRLACQTSVRRDAVKMRLHESGPLTLFVQRLGQYADRPLDEETGLSGRFEWDLTFSVNRDPAADSDFAPLESAIVDQLGLKLAPRMAPRQVLIIDSVQAPTEN